jgi:hypothetical protein
MSLEFDQTSIGAVGAIRQSTHFDTGFNPGGVVFNSRGSFNPTTLAVQTSLEEDLFNEGMQNRIIEGLRITDVGPLT